jgi:hypothetical protein
VGLHIDLFQARSTARPNRDLTHTQNPNFAEALQYHLRRTTRRALPAGRKSGSERVAMMLKTPPKAARSGPKSMSPSETTLSDAVGGNVRSQSSVQLLDSLCTLGL